MARRPTRLRSISKNKRARVLKLAPVLTIEGEKDGVHQLHYVCVVFRQGRWREQTAVDRGLLAARGVGGGAGAIQSASAAPCASGASDGAAKGSSGPAP